MRSDGQRRGNRSGIYKIKVIESRIKEVVIGLGWIGIEFG